MSEDKLVPQQPENSGLENAQIESLPLFLEALQQRYRTEMGDAEYLDWLQTLRGYRLLEVIAAANELTLNPPEGWTGLPKLPDMLRVIHKARDAEAEERRRAEGAKLLANLRDLERRKANGEQFYTLADVLKALPGKTLKTMPEFADIDTSKNAEKLERQKELLTKSSTQGGS